MNKYMILGHLGRDPELRHTQSGKAVCNFSVATSEKYKNKDEEWVEKTEWHKVVTWGKLAENCAKFLEKGRQVLVEGKAQTREWEDKEGIKRYTTECNAQNVQFLGGGKGKGSGGQQAPTPSDDDIPF